jgi:hypothetical protein
MPKSAIKIIVFLILSSLIFAATGDWESPTSSANSGADWVNPDSCFASDNERTTNAGTGQLLLDTEGYGFTVDDGATIDSIIVRVEGYGTSSTESEREVAAQLTNHMGIPWGDIISNNALPEGVGSEDYIEIRGTSDDLWGTGFGESVIEDSDFGVYIQKESSAADSVNIDHVQIQVWWSFPSELSGRRRRLILDQ